MPGISGLNSQLLQLNALLGHTAAVSKPAEDRLKGTVPSPDGKGAIPYRDDPKLAIKEQEQHRLQINLMLKAHAEATVKTINDHAKKVVDAMAKQADDLDRFNRQFTKHNADMLHQIETQSVGWANGVDLLNKFFMLADAMDLAYKQGNVNKLMWAQEQLNNVAKLIQLWMGKAGAQFNPQDFLGGTKKPGSGSGSGGGSAPPSASTSTSSGGITMPSIGSPNPSNGKW
jgi:hypothetical protein